MEMEHSPQLHVRSVVILDSIEERREGIITYFPAAPDALDHDARVLLPTHAADDDHDVVRKR